MSEPFIDIICPTLGRAEKLPEFVANVHATTTTPHIVTFVFEKDDQATIDAIAFADDLFSVRWVANDRSRTCNGAFNAGVAHIERRATHWFAAGDDLKFHPGWDVDALAEFKFCLAAGTGGVQYGPCRYPRVVGTNDLYHPGVKKGETATHFLVDAGYVAELGGDFDETPGIAGHEGYVHNFFDTEFCEVAKARGVFRPCLASVVEHMHWSAGKRPKDAQDEINHAGETPDRRLFAERKAAWLARKAAA